jgi:hypothetical protein
MRKITHAYPPKPKRRKPAPAPKAAVIVEAKSPKQIAKDKRIALRRERGY